MRASEEGASTVFTLHPAARLMHALRLCNGNLRGSADVESNEAIDSAACIACGHIVRPHRDTASSAT